MNDGHQATPPDPNNDVATIRCPECWNGKTIPCATGCREWDECCDKKLDVPCERCEGTGVLRGE